MNRVIKFRAWDTEKNEMMDVPGLVFEYETPTVIENMGEHYKEDAGRFPVMQFTGLHDAFGKEVYEGDILEMDGREWDRSGKTSSPRYVMEFQKGAQFSAGSWTAYDISEWCKVIGNIYENSDLLSEPKEKV